MTQKTTGDYCDPCSEDREIGGFERDLILGATAAYYKIKRPYSVCEPWLCRNATEHRVRIGNRHESLRGCPYRFISEHAHYYLDLYAHYKAGFLEQAGGILDQSVEYLNAMMIIDRTIAELEEERTADLKRRQNNG